MFDMNENGEVVRICLSFNAEELSYQELSLHIFEAKQKRQKNKNDGCTVGTLVNPFKLNTFFLGSQNICILLTAEEKKMYINKTEINVHDGSKRPHTMPDTLNFLFVCKCLRLNAPRLIVLKPGIWTH